MKEKIKEKKRESNSGSALTDKEWLDLSWKYFQQHAQQRVSYFNFFIVFSSVLTTGYVSSFQKSYGLPGVGIGVSLIQLFVAFIFIKIDQRNSRLIKHAENAIKKFEEAGASAMTFPLFTSEDQETKLEQQKNQSTFIFFQHFTHGRSFRWIYSFFLLLGLTGIILSSLTLALKKNETEQKPVVNNISFYKPKDDSSQVSKSDERFVSRLIQLFPMKIFVRKMSKKIDYIPSPIPTTDLKIPDSLNMLIELLAENIHENWAKERISQGWRFGPRSHDQKFHPNLIPYHDLPEEEKVIDRTVAKETIKVIIKLGFEIINKHPGLTI